MVQQVPLWGQLPDYAQEELSAAHYDNRTGGFEFDTKPDHVRLTVLNLYVKLSPRRAGPQLWDYVAQPSPLHQSLVGCLEFLTNDVDALKQELDDHPDFTEDVFVNGWGYREKRDTCALHFKYFKGWPRHKVQAHIDLFGLGPAYVGPVAMGLRHWIFYHGYEEVFVIRALLLQQGWDPKPLLGVNAVGIPRVAPPAPGMIRIINPG